MLRYCTISCACARRSALRNRPARSDTDIDMDMRPYCNSMLRGVRPFLPRSSALFGCSAIVAGAITQYSESPAYSAKRYRYAAYVRSCLAHWPGQLPSTLLNCFCTGPWHTCRPYDVSPPDRRMIVSAHHLNVCPKKPSRVPGIPASRSTESWAMASSLLRCSSVSVVLGRHQINVW